MTDVGQQAPEARVQRGPGDETTITALWADEGRGADGRYVTYLSYNAGSADVFRFDRVTGVTDENLLPGALKYGGTPAFLALCAPGEVFAHNHAGTSSGHLSKAAYDAAKAPDALKRQPEKAKPEDIVAWLTR
jgi:hypothetical protein